MLKVGSRGDTIVEVLLAMAIVSSVLGGAYVVSQRSFKNTRQAQEHTEALRLSQTQLERIKVLSATNPAVFTTAAPFCITSSNTIETVVANCTSGAVGYSTTVTSVTPVGANAFTFSVETVWDNAVGTGQDTVKLSYRINRP